MKTIGLIILGIILYFFIGMLVYFFVLVLEKFFYDYSYSDYAEEVVLIISFWPIIMIFGSIFLIINILQDKLPDLVDLLYEVYEEHKERKEK